MAPSRPTYSLINIHDVNQERMSMKSETASAIFAKIAPAPVGYPGQFCGVTTREQAMSGTSSLDPVSIFIVNYPVDRPGSGSSPAHNKSSTMGEFLHSNYLFTHTNFYPCPHEDKLDYRVRTARPGTQLFHSIEYADELAGQAAKTPRTAAEEALRRQVHREAARARLEGVSVGEYHYYQGHLTIEDYVEAGMCICWEACECAKMCTRFPDMFCPCSRYIELHQQ